MGDCRRTRPNIAIDRITVTILLGIETKKPHSGYVVYGSIRFGTKLPETISDFTLII